MKCKLCGRSTDGFLELYHPECLDIIRDQWASMDAVLTAYESGHINASTAKLNILSESMQPYLQKHFWDSVFPKSSISPDAQLIYSHDLIECSEEKNRCRMVRPGLSYAKYPEWTCSPVSLYDVTSFALTDTGVFLLGFHDHFIPYKKVLDVGTELVLFKLALYFDVKTTSPHRHRYRIWPTDGKDSAFAINAHRLLRLMIA